VGQTSICIPFRLRNGDALANGEIDEIGCEYVRNPPKIQYNKASRLIVDRADSRNNGK